MFSEKFSCADVMPFRSCTDVSSQSDADSTNRPPLRSKGHVVNPHPASAGKTRACSSPTAAFGTSSFDAHVRIHAKHVHDSPPPSPPPACILTVYYSSCLLLALHTN